MLLLVERAAPPTARALLSELVMLEKPKAGPLARALGLGVCPGGPGVLGSAFGYSTLEANATHMSISLSGDDGSDADHGVGRLGAA